MNYETYIIRKIILRHKNKKKYNITNFNTYKKKKKLLTETELKFYNILKEITDKLELTICPQVSIYNIIETNNKREFENISRKSIDFVITKKNLDIICCIELDDYTHNKQERIKRDNFINQLFLKTNVKLYRIKVSNYYDKTKIKNMIMGS